MLCPHCGAQWQLPTSANSHVKKCPFCQGDMRAKDDTLNSMESVLKEIVARFGTNILNDGQELLSLFETLAPSLTKEKAVVQFFVECGGHTALSKLQGASFSEQELGCQKQIQKMLESITGVCNSYLAALGVQYQSDIQEQTVLEYEYADLGNNTAELTLCNSSLREEIRFPNVIDGKQVVSISGNIFGTGRIKESDRSNVKTLIIPEGVTNIGAGAFHSCKSLKKVVLPKGLLSIGEYAFRSCKALTSIVLPESLTSMGKGVFAGTYLTTIAIPEGVESIPSEAFKNCKLLTNVALPKSIKYIGKEAFSGCRSIISVSIPENVITIDDRVFQECKTLTNVKLPDGITSLGWFAFEGCESLHTINLPDTITCIEGGAFQRCFAISEVTLPKGISAINGGVFDRCRSLTKVYIPEGVKTIEYDAFESCEGLHITIPKSVLKIDGDAFSYCKNVTVQCYENTLAHEYAKKKKWNIELI